MHTCRFCKSYDKHQSFVKYATRHWAHYDCWLKAKGAELADPANSVSLIDLLRTCLHDWQIRQFPVFPLADWMKERGSDAPGKSWVDKACFVIKEALKPERVQA